MPFYGIASLLGFDRLSRKEQFKQLFGIKRKMAASDSTIKRALMWLKEAKLILGDKDKSDTDNIIESKGFDPVRLCSWRIEIISGDFAGISRITSLKDFPI